MLRISILAFGLFGPLPLVRDAARTGETVELGVARSARVRIPAGPFRMGSDEDDIAAVELLCMREGVDERVCSGVNYVDEMPVREVRLAAYRIDRTETTVAAYGRCVQAGVCRSPLQFPADHRFDGATQPVVGVSWADAGNYCHWTRGRLPTEAEWERAARGTDQRTFPWGRAWNPALSNHGRPGRASLGGADPDDRDGFRFTSPVGSFRDGAGPSGVLDMAGNAWEWVADYYGAEYDPDATIAPRGPATGVYRVIRGGSWATPSFLERAAMRSQGLPDQRSLELGFRCAEDAN